MIELLSKYKNTESLISHKLLSLLLGPLTSPLLFPPIILLLIYYIICNFFVCVTN